MLIYFGTNILLSIASKSNDKTGVSTMDGELTFSGFRKIDPYVGQQIKTMAADFFMRFKRQNRHLWHLHIHVKPVHQNPHTKKYELHAKALADDLYSADNVSYNPFSGTADLLVRLKATMED